MCLDLHEKIFTKQDFLHIMLTTNLEKWVNHLKIYTDGSKCDIKTACAFFA